MANQLKADGQNQPQSMQQCCIDPTLLEQGQQTQQPNMNGPNPGPHAYRFNPSASDQFTNIAGVYNYNQPQGMGNVGPEFRGMMPQHGYVPFNPHSQPPHNSPNAGYGSQLQGPPGVPLELSPYPHPNAGMAGNSFNTQFSTLRYQNQPLIPVSGSYPQQRQNPLIQPENQAHNLHLNVQQANPFTQKQLASGLDQQLMGNPIIPAENDIEPALPDESNALGGQKNANYIGKKKTGTKTGPIRRRAGSACDRCVRRKTACKDVGNDRNKACEACSASGWSCLQQGEERGVEDREAQALKKENDVLRKMNHDLKEENQILKDEIRGWRAAIDGENQPENDEDQPQSPSDVNNNHNNHEHNNYNHHNNKGLTLGAGSLYLGTGPVSFGTGDNPSNPLNKGRKSQEPGV